MTQQQEQAPLGKWRLTDGTMITEIDPSKLHANDKTYEFAWNATHVFDVVNDKQGRACFVRDAMNGIVLEPVDSCRSFLMTRPDGRPISTMIVHKDSNLVEWSRVWEYKETDRKNDEPYPFDITATDIDAIQSFIKDQGFTPYNKNPYRSAGLIKVDGEYHDVRALPSDLTIDGDVSLREMGKIPGFDGVPADLKVTGRYEKAPQKAPLNMKQRIAGILSGGPKNPGTREINSSGWMEA